MNKHSKDICILSSETSPRAVVGSLYYKRSQQVRWEMLGVHKFWFCLKDLYQSTSGRRVQGSLRDFAAIHPPIPGLQGGK